MAAGDTVITLVGNLVDDPELRFTPSGAAVAKFRMASTPRYLDKTTNEWKDGGEVEKVDIWGRRRMSFEIAKKSEGIYAVVDLQAEPATVKELDRQLNLNEAVLRTKVIRPDQR